MNAYATVERNCPTPLTSVDISRLFRRADDWFARASVRRRLYQRGFPHPFERGLWSAQAVNDWLADAGRNPEGATPRRRTRQRSRRGRDAYTHV